MKQIQDTIQVGVANSSANFVSISDINEYLTFVSLALAIIFTVYKFFRYEKKKAGK